MIYEPVDVDLPLRQGDIFVSIALPEWSMTEVPRLKEDGSFEQIDLSAVNAPTDVHAVVLLRMSTVIVVSQDCDCARGEYVSVAPVVGISTIIPDGQEPKNPKRWASYISKSAKEKLRYFYLPPDGNRVIAVKSVADFRSVSRVRLADMLSVRARGRRMRLNEVASDHFKEQLAHFFRRYAYNEWYPMDRDEFAAYREEKKAEQIDPYGWQT